jgi:hypothetical protein
MGKARMPPFLFYCKKPLTDNDRGDPHVWSGRALQEGFVDLADVRSCINVSGF